MPSTATRKRFHSIDQPSTKTSAGIPDSTKSSPQMRTSTVPSPASSLHAGAPTTSSKRAIVGLLDRDRIVVVHLKVLPEQVVLGVALGDRDDEVAVLVECREVEVVERGVALVGVDREHLQSQHLVA